MRGMISNEGSCHLRGLLFPRLCVSTQRPTLATRLVLTILRDAEASHCETDATLLHDRFYRIRQSLTATKNVSSGIVVTADAGQGHSCALLR